MKRLQLLISICMCCCLLRAQHLDYSDYNAQMLRVEELTAQEDFDGSLDLYGKIFKAYPFVFAKDAYNACQIAALQKHAGFNDFFSRCAECGIEKKRLLGNVHILQAYQTAPAALDVLYEKGYGKYLGRIDTVLRKEFLLRHETEQKNKGKERYSEICSDNFNRILELTIKGQFPGEYLVGTGPSIESFVFPTLLHYPYAYVKLLPYLKDALKAGQVMPLSVVYLYGFNQARTSILYTPDIPQDTVHFKAVYNMMFGRRSADLDAVNKARGSAGIFSVQTQAQLRSVSEKYGLNYLFGYY